MSRDNVTPFRPRRPPPKVAKKGPGLSSHRGKAVLVQATTLLAFAVSVGLNFASLTPLMAGLMSFVPMVFGVIGVLIAAANRRDAMPWAATHHEHALRTLMFGFAITIVASLVANAFPPAAPAVLVLSIAVLAWVVLRAGVGLVLALMRKPIWNPKGPLL